MIPLLFILVFLGSLFIPPDTIDSEKGRLIITFFGLFAGGILPTISLLVSNTLSPALSIDKLKEINCEVNLLIGRLGQTIGFIVLGAIFVVIALFDLPQIPSQVGGKITPDWLQQLPERFFQAGAMACFATALDRLRLVRIAYGTVLRQKYEIAKKQSEQRIKDNKRRLGTPEKFFPKGEDFGRVVKVEPNRVS